MKTIHFSTYILFISIITLFCSCNDNPDAYVISKGSPTISYFRLTNSAKKDSVISESFMGTTVAVVGQNLRSVVKVFFNDQPAELNTSFITPTSMIIVVPNAIPTKLTNKVYFVSQSGDTIKYNFKVKVPAPVVSSMNCEYVSDGDIATINGDFFIDDPNQHLEVYFTNNKKATEIQNITKTQIKVKVPIGSDVGKITVRSVYGEGFSKFMFRDNRFIILDFDNSYPNSDWGKFADLKKTNPTGVSGNYVYFKDNLKTDIEWKDATLMFEYDGMLAGFPEGNLFTGNPDSLALKFEINVVSPWKQGYLQCIFTPWGLNSAARFPLYHDISYPRILWRPWLTSSTGSFSTDGWTTVSLPLNQAIYSPDGTNNKLKLDKNAFGNMTFFVWGGNDSNTPRVGTASDIYMCIDNIRVVPLYEK